MKTEDGREVDNREDRADVKTEERGDLNAISWQIQEHKTLADSKDQESLEHRPYLALTPAHEGVDDSMPVHRSQSILK